MCYVIIVFLFFFFKQKTAYEMRISDWSSDVCSSDLPGLVAALAQRVVDNPPPRLALAHLGVEARQVPAGADPGHEALHQFRLRRLGRQVAQLQRVGLEVAELRRVEVAVIEIEAAHAKRPQRRRGKIGRASCGARVCEYV